MKKPKNIEITFWIGFVILVLIVLESSTYFATGTFVWCSRYGSGCSNLYPREFLKLIYLLLGCIGFVSVFSRSKKWSSLLQNYYISSSKKSLFSRREQFEGRFFRLILRTCLVFVALVILAMGFSILFGPIILN